MKVVGACGLLVPKGIASKSLVQKGISPCGSDGKTLVIYHLRNTEVFAENSY